LSMIGCRHCPAISARYAQRFTQLIAMSVRERQSPLSMSNMTGPARAVSE
jgi:hypothetical protein